MQMNLPEQILKDIKLSLKKKFTKIEVERLSLDLESVYERLVKREYNKGGFASNKFNVPDRTREFYIYLKFYCDIGKNWLPILEAIGINKYKQVVDLGPGYTPKVELALFYAGYKGEVVAIDKESKSLSEMKQFMELFNPQFQITKKKLNIFSKHKNTYPVLICNHLIDDLVIDFYIKKYGFTKKEIYEKEEKIKELWTKITSKRKENLEEIVPLIAKALSALTKKNGYVLMSQYKSYMEKLLNMDSATRFTRTAFNNVIALLCKEYNFSNDKKIVNQALRKHHGHFGIRDCAVLRKG